MLLRHQKFDFGFLWLNLHSVCVAFRIKVVGLGMGLLVEGLEVLAYVFAVVF